MLEWKSISTIPMAPLRSAEIFKTKKIVANKRFGDFRLKHNRCYRRQENLHKSQECPWPPLWDPPSGSWVSFGVEYGGCRVRCPTQNIRRNNATLQNDFIIKCETRNFRFDVSAVSLIPESEVHLFLFGESKKIEEFSKLKKNGCANKSILRQKKHLWEKINPNPWSLNAASAV